MAKITEILEIEKDRNNKEKWNVIHLFKEGNFYRAFNWSAWLIVAFTYTDDVRKDSKDRKPLVVSHRLMNKSGDDYLVVGFPLKSLEKFIPNTLNFIPISDTQIDIVADLSQTDDDYEGLLSKYEEWKNGIEVKEPKKKYEKKTSEDVIVSPIKITIILSQVLSYPLEQKSPIENMEFISLLKRQLAALL